ncbi:winged helix-turn-helix domain-containing protein [Corynebacterium argentoratense]|uniref:winged helix-turn-helix domain-containing protein n=1 Tax=Corynebacterium argentoratense TaxID=42817 RepID=UPI0028E3341B|nr:winged helix-turn-helix domain-containing protein [Corynebacterium argentoratense]
MVTRSDPQPRQPRVQTGPTACGVGENYNRETNYLRVYLLQLRQKLEADPKNPRHFITLPSVGYRFEQ